jgi:hypothetical protein
MKTEKQLHDELGRLKEYYQLLIAPNDIFIKEFEDPELDLGCEITKTQARIDFLSWVLGDITF